MMRHGFSEVWSSRQECSRNFGIVVVFEKQNKKENQSTNHNFTPNHSAPNKYLTARERQIEEVTFPTKFLFNWVEKKKLIVFWGANYLLELIVRSGTLAKEQIMVVDINPSKLHRMSNYGFECIDPDKFIDGYGENPETRSIKNEECEVVITAAAHAADIVARIGSVTMNYRVFDPRVDGIQPWPDWGPSSSTQTRQNLDAEPKVRSILCWV